MFTFRPLILWSTATSLAWSAFSAGAGAQTIPAFPGAEGYGAYAKGGRGGDVYHVTNLNSSGAGSFADAITTVPAAGRTIVFDVSGYIRIPNSSNGLRMTASKVTIAGQTAPGDGVGFYNNFFRISGDDVVVRHVRFRMGKYGSGGDCVDLDSGTLNAILDHVSMQFSTDENMSSFGSPPENLTLQYSLNAWGLESHSCGGLWDQNHATSHHNLWAHNHTRNPKARPNGLLEWINNVTFDWDIGFIMGDSETPAAWKANVINNYFICPPGNTQSKALVKGTVASNGLPNFTVFLSGNLIDNNGDGVLNGSDKGYSIVEGSPWSAVESPAPAAGAYRYYQAGAAMAGSSAGVATDAPLLAYRKIVSNAGALRLDVSYGGALRDEVDAILFSKLVNLQRGHVTRESDTGASGSGFGTLRSVAAPVDTDKDGMPDYYEDALGWTKTAQDHNTALASSGGVLTGTTFFPANTPAGYTRLEEYLHFLSIPHGTVPKNIAGSPTSLVIDLRKFTSGFSSSPIFAVANVAGGTVALSGSGNAIATFTPTLNYTGRARFDFTVTDSEGSSWTQSCAIVVANNALPRDLVWNGAGNAWDTAATNWLRSATGSAVAYSDGDRVAFDQTGVSQPNVSVAGALSPTTVEVNAVGDYTLGGAGSINSTGSLTKRGAGTLTISHAESYTGGTSLEAGTLAIASPGSLGGGTITMLDGTALTNAYPTGTTSTIAPALNVPAGNAATIHTGNRLVLSGSFTGAGTLNCDVQTTISRADLKGAAAAFTGAVNFTSGGGVRLFFNGGGFNGFDNASVDVGGSVSLQPQTNSGGNTCNIAALSGASASANLAGGSAGAVAYVIGSNNNSTRFAGSITGNASLTKTGAGTLTLGGANTYAGATNVNSGWLLVDGSLGGTAVTVAAGATLGGSGTVGGSVTASAGAGLSPGTVEHAGATLTVNGALSLNGNTLYYDLTSSPAGANDRVAMNGGALALSGAQNFQFSLVDGTLAAGVYDLITGAGATTGTPTFTHNLPSGTRQTFALGMLGNTVRLTVTGNPATLTWTGATSANWDTATANNWSGATPNSFATNDAVVFDDTSAVNAVTIPTSVAPRSIVVSNNARAYTIGGASQTAAAITGGASLTKSGAGALILTGVNSFTGGTTIQSGATITLANDNANAGALGTGMITLNGGALTMFDSAASFTTATLNLAVPAGQSGALNADSRCDLYGSLTGGGTFNFRVPWVRTTLFADWSAFTGTINVTTDADGGDLRMGTSYSFPGFPLASVNLADRVWAYYTGTLSAGAGTTIEIGELSGGALSVLEGGGTSGRNFTYRIGGKTAFGSEVVFAGAIQEQNANTTTSFVKTGAGTWKLSGTCSWNGGTTVEQGTLKISGAVASGAAVHVASGAGIAFAGGSLSADAVNVSAGATLSGNGAIYGDLNNDGSVACDAGALTVNGDVVNNGTMRFAGGAALNASGRIVNNGVLDLLTGAEGLPINLENNGVVIDSSSLRTVKVSRTGDTVTISVQTWGGHLYQLQRADSLALPNWSNLGTAQAGDGSVRSFTDSAATGTQRFYRVVVTP